MAGLSKSYCNLKKSKFQISANSTNENIPRITDYHQTNTIFFNCLWLHRITPIVLGVISIKTKLNHRHLYNTVSNYNFTQFTV